ncbi:ester cyclase [Priestia megaterium]|uniref:ester cyclase n=1 Tax=Priestia megaterium TaxID=1404 RepID=UPI0036D7BFE0
MNKLENNKEIVNKFITEALPNNDIDYVRQVVSKDAVTHRAGFAALYEATGDAIPKKGNFLEWMEKGWDVLHSALSDQKVEMKHVVAEGNKVIAQFHYYVTHKGTFVGMPATNKRIEWDEVGIFEFNDDGQITDMWYMCEEIKLAMEVGFKLDK